MTFQYLASPYSHEDPLTREKRYLETLKGLLALGDKGIVAYSPIAHFHPMAKLYSMESQANDWAWHNIPMIKASSGLIILMLDHWGTSSGVSQERQWAKEFGKSIQTLDPDGWVLEAIK